MKIRCIYLTLAVFFIISHPAAVMAKESIPVAVTLMLTKGGQLVNSEKTEEAVTLLENFQAKALKVDAETAARKGYTHYLIDFSLGNYHLMLTHTQKAVVCYRTALKKKPDLSDAWLNLAKCYYDLEQMKNAGQAFLKGYETSTAKKPAHLYYSSIGYMMADDAKTAYTIFQRLLKTHPQEIELSWKESLVQILFSLEKYREALPYIEELAEKSVDKKKKEWQEVLLSQYIMLKMNKKALAYAEWLTATDPLEPKWWKALCHLHLSEDRLEKGLASLIIYSFLTPLTDQENSLMADLYMMVDVPTKAVEYYQAILKDAPLSPELTKKIARGYIRLHDRETALSWIEKSLKKEEDIDLMMLQANLLYETGQYQDAADVYGRICCKKKKSGEAYLMMGYAFWNIGDLCRAKTAFTEACTYKKQKKSADNALRQLAMAEKN